MHGWPSFDLFFLAFGFFLVWFGSVSQSTKKKIGAATFYFSFFWFWFCLVFVCFVFCLVWFGDLVMGAFCFFCAIEFGCCVPLR